MLILAVDTTTRSGSVAVLRDQAVLGVIGTESEEPYSSRLFRQVEELLFEVRLGLKQMDVFAVAAGPGSFTGLRVGLTAVKAWAEVFGAPIGPVSVLAAVAAQARCPQGWLAAAMDAHRGQVFGAIYDRRDPSQPRPADEMVVTVEEFVAEIRRRADGQRFDLITTSPDVLREPISKLGLFGRELAARMETASPVLAPIIGQLACGDYVQGRFVDALSLDANYVRRSDAEIFWKGQGTASAANPIPRSTPLIQDGRIRVRPLTAKDEADIARLDAADSNVGAWRKGIHLNGGGLSIYDHWVAEKDGDVIGYLCGRAVADEFEILDIVVAPAARRRSAGTALLEKAILAARAAAAGKVHLEVRASNAAAIAFYRRHGFQEAGRRKNYYQDPLEDALLLSRSLD